MLHRILLLSKQLLLLGNYHAAYAIYRALTMKCVSRLSRTWNNITSLTSGQIFECYERLFQLFGCDFEEAFLTKLKESNPPFIPPIQRMAQSFSSIHHEFKNLQKSNPDKEGIYFSKLAQLSEIILILRKAKSASYGFATHDVVQEFLFSST